MAKRAAQTDERAGSNPADERDLRGIFDTIEFPDAYRIAYLANAIVIPGYEAVKQRFGIIRVEYVLLCSLAHYDRLTAQEVARISRQPRNTVSRSVHRMLAEGYLERVRDTADARQQWLTLTPSGRRLHEQVAAMLCVRQDLVLDGLDDAERRQLSALLRKAARHAATLAD